MEEILNDLETLFAEAKNISEFDFVLTLINYKGMGSQHLMTNLHEWFQAIEFYKKLYLDFSGKEKTRIGVLLYSTFFENSDFYNILGSLCRIKLGFKGSSFLFWKTKKYERLLGIGEKQDFLIELLDDAEKPQIINFFEKNHFKAIRNTFFHSAYSLSETEYILHDSEPLNIDGIENLSIDVEGFIYPTINNVISFFDKFKELYFDSFYAYTSDKEVEGKFPNLSKITILGSSLGLKGFVIKNAVVFYGKPHDSGIEYDEDDDMWEGQNINLYFDNLETIEIREQLSRYENKADINKSDAEFHNIIDKVTERNIPTEMIRAVNLLAKFGQARDEKMQAEQNLYKKSSFPNIILPYYTRAVELGENISDMSVLKQRIKELQE